MNQRVFPLKTGCFVTVVFLILFFLNIPSVSEHPFYFILWLIGLFSMPTLIALFFGLGTVLGSFLNIFTSVFRSKNKKEKDENYYNPDNGNYINIDKYNTDSSKNKDSDIESTN